LYFSSINYKKAFQRIRGDLNALIKQDSIQVQDNLIKQRLLNIWKDLNPKSPENINQLTTTPIWVLKQNLE